MHLMEQAPWKGSVNSLVDSSESPMSGAVHGSIP